MGPTNQLLVKLFDADQKYRQALGRYDAASRDVRIQERKIKDLSGKLEIASGNLKRLQATASNTELDIKTREAKIERLREQQQTAKNNKEYQAFLVQIATDKVDKGKAEDELLKLMEQVETAQGEVAQFSAQLEIEKQKFEGMRQQITGRLEAIQQDIDQLKPVRDAAAAQIPAKVLEVFERLADRFEGEAMAAMSRPDRRVEEYACAACNMSMAVDIYNRLHSRDEPMFCPSCRRFLYIPEDLGPDEAINQKKKTKKESTGEEADSSSQSPAEQEA